MSDSLLLLTPAADYRSAPLRAAGAEEEKDDDGRPACFKEIPTTKMAAAEARPNILTSPTVSSPSNTMKEKEATQTRPPHQHRTTTTTAGVARRAMYYCNAPNLHLVLLRGPPQCQRHLALSVPCLESPPTSSSFANIEEEGHEEDEACLKEKEEGLIIGRGVDCDVVLDPWLLFASGRHAALFCVHEEKQKSNEDEDKTSKRLQGSRKGVPSRSNKHPSSSHAADEEMNFFIVDLHSSNGTFVNKRRIRSGIPHRLQHSDTLIFGGMQDVEGELDREALQRPELVLWRVETPAGAADERRLFGEDSADASLLRDEEDSHDGTAGGGLYEATPLPLLPTEEQLDSYTHHLLEAVMSRAHQPPPPRDDVATTTTPHSKKTDPVPSVTPGVEKEFAAPRGAVGERECNTAHSQSEMATPCAHGTSSAGEKIQTRTAQATPFLGAAVTPTPSRPTVPLSNTTLFSPSTAAAAATPPVDPFLVEPESSRDGTPPPPPPVTPAGAVVAPSPSQRHHHASERSGNKKETNRSLEHEFSAAMVSGASFTFPAQAPPLQPHAMMDTQKKRDAEEEEDEEDPSLTALLGPITALPHLFPATPSPAVTAALTPSRSGARRRLRGDGVETKTHGDLWPAPFCFTGARLGKWRHMPADDAEAAAARLQRGGKITCFLSVEEDNAEITVAEKKNVNKKCAQTQARKRLRGDETPTGAGRDAPPHCSLTFTSTHWWWGLTRRAEPHCQDVVRVRCALPLASISSVLVCPTLYGLAVELAAGVVQLPCGVPPDVIAGDPLHRWAVWWWSPPSSTSSSSSVNPPKGTGATARSGQLSNEGSAQDNIHDRPNTNTHKRKSAMKSRALSKKKTTEPQPVTEEIAAVEFGAWVRLLHQCLAVWGLPEPHCVDEEMFCYLIHEEEEED